jgi:hypothetical protein
MGNSPTELWDGLHSEAQFESSDASLRKVGCGQLPKLGLCNADLGEDFIAVLTQSPDPPLFRSKLCNQRRNISTARSGNFLKQRNGI